MGITFSMTQKKVSVTVMYIIVIREVIRSPLKEFMANNDYFLGFIVPLKGHPGILVLDPSSHIFRLNGFLKVR